MTDLSFESLTPTDFLARSALVFADRPAVVDGEFRATYAELWDRVQRLAGGLAGLGVSPGDRVAVLAPNSHVLLEATFGVPASGAVMVPLNIRLAAPEVAYILDHSEADVLIYDASLAGAALEAVGLADRSPTLVAADDATVEAPQPASGGQAHRYEDLISQGDPLVVPVADERSPLSINYTSGTTGTPKGVLYHHRGAYLQALAMALHTKLDASSAYLWTLPMFHCQGWCFPWAVTLTGATHVCLRAVEPTKAWSLIREEKVTHLCAAPTVLITLLGHADAPDGPLDPRLLAVLGGAPPSPALISRARNAGIEVMHLYGLTETYGPAAICEPQPEWAELDADALAERTSRQGVANAIGERVRVVDGDGADVPADGTTVGTITLRGNNLMLGYHRDEARTAEAAPDGFFRTGDLGVMQPDGYVQIVDRSKDIIISGGENIPSVEVENALAAHPSVLEAAVVARPDEKWGEIPVAYVTLAEGIEPAETTGEELSAFLAGRIARFKVPRQYRFGHLPKTSTGKIQKNVLRERATDAS